MRITNSILYRQGLGDVSGQRARLAAIQEQASSGLRINRPSDDPVGVRAAVLYRDAISLTNQYLETTTRSRFGRISATESALAGVNEALIRTRELALQGANDSNDAVARRNIASEVDRLREAVFAEANRVVDGAHVFAGFRSDAPAFSETAGVISFDGTNDEIMVDIDEGVQLQVTLDGERVFMGGEDLFDVLSSLSTALNADSGSAIAAILPRLDAGITQISEERTRIGSSDAKAELWEARHGQREADLTAQLSETEDADSVEVFSNLVQQEATLQASLEVTARLLQPSLLDFL